MEQDSKLLLDIIPQEIWVKMFDKFAEIKCYDDLENSINSSEYFRLILENKRTTFLSPKVFSHLLPKYINSVEKEYIENGRPVTATNNISESTGSDIPEGKVLPSKQAPILKIRRICKTWCETIDQYYQTLDSHYKMENDFYENKPYELPQDDSFEEKVDRFKESYTCWEYKYALKFIEHYDKTHFTKNPFIGRSISISEGSPGEQTIQYHNAPICQADYRFYNAIATILENYGKHLWYCEVNIRDKFPSRVEYYRQIKLWLILMPNLKVFKLSYKMQIPDFQNPTRGELTQLKREIGRSPWPKLGNLKFLMTCNVPAPIFNDLVQSNEKRLELLEIERKKGEDGYNIYSVKMTNLRQLSIQIYSFEELRKLRDQKVEWKLEKLYLDAEIGEIFIPWSIIFKLINNYWADSLTNLMINLPKARTKQDRLRLKEIIDLDLPNLKRCKLLFGNETPIDFILPMKNKLEIVELGLLYYAGRTEEQEYRKRRNTNQIIAIVGFEETLYESNIWELFPKLEKLQVWGQNYFPFSTESRDYMHLRQEWKKRGGQALLEDIEVELNI